MNTLHLLALLATVLADAAASFALPAVSAQHHHSRPAAASYLGFGNRLPGANGQHWLRGSRATVGQTSSDGPQFQHNDRSVYDPGVDNIPLSAFIASDEVAEQPPPPFDENNAVAEPSLADGDGDAIDNDDDEDGQHAELLKQLRAHIKEDEDVAAKSALLLKMLESFTDGEQMPLVYVEDEPNEAPVPVVNADNGLAVLPDKRSGRYYRRYPWKRENARYHSYELDQRYLCVPNRNDILKLLIGLDKGRKGNNGHTVNFCNRKRPAKAIFSNIRFLG